VSGSLGHPLLSAGRRRAELDEAALVAPAHRDCLSFAPLYERYFGPIYRCRYHWLGDCSISEVAARGIFANALASLPRFSTDVGCSTRGFPRSRTNLSGTATTYGTTTGR
jgi:hypothetical protein